MRLKAYIKKIILKLLLGGKIKKFLLGSVKTVLDKLPFNYRKTAIGVTIALLGIVAQSYVSNEYVLTVINELIAILSEFEYEKLSYENITTLVGIITASIGIFHKALKLVDKAEASKEIKTLEIRKIYPQLDLISDAIKCIKQDEGYRNKLYKDTVGKLTIGVGYNIDDRGLPEDIIYTLLTRDIEEAIKTSERLIGSKWKKFTHLQKLAVINLAFNLGETRLKQFKKTLTLLREGKFEEARENIRKTLWARQVKSRSIRVSDLFINKVTEYNIKGK